MSRSEKYRKCYDLPSYMLIKSMTEADEIEEDFKPCLDESILEKRAVAIFFRITFSTLLLYTQTLSGAWALLPSYTIVVQSPS